MEYLCLTLSICLCALYCLWNTFAALIFHVFISAILTFLTHNINCSKTNGSIGSFLSTNRNMRIHHVVRYSLFVSPIYNASLSTGSLDAISLAIGCINSISPPLSIPQFSLHLHLATNIIYIYTYTDIYNSLHRTLRPSLSRTLSYIISLHPIHSLHLSQYVLIRSFSLISLALSAAL